MTKKFDLGAILSVLSGRKLIDDFTPVSELFTFAFDFGMSVDLFVMSEMRVPLAKHILGLYPELGRINYSQMLNIDRAHQTKE